MSALNAALALAAAGVPVFPCHENKTPACANGFRDATTDTAAIRDLFSRAGAELIGVPTGEASGLDVLDLDPRHGSDDWLREHGAAIPVTRTHGTRSGGRHIVFRHRPGLRCSAGGRGTGHRPGVDIKADGGYIIHWPSAGVAILADVVPAEWPEALLAEVTRRPAASVERAASALPPPSASDVVDLLERLPNPLSVDRDTYARVMLAAAGCVRSLGDDPGGLIEDAAVAWAERWEGGSVSDERLKWADDWSARTELKAGWDTLLGIAGKLNPGYCHPSQGSEFAALPPLSDEHPDAWRSMLQMTDKDAPKGNLFNACHAFRTAPAWRGVLRHDDFANRIEMVGSPPWHDGALFLPRELTDVDVVRAATWLQQQGIQVKGNDARDALMDEADHSRFHPIRVYLDGLRWDGTPRIDGWLSDYLGAADTRLNRAYAAKFLLSMVARVRQPGSKVDTVLILEGRQGLRKSTALAVLAGVRWFTDHMPDISSKDAMEQLQGKWLIEHAELDKLSKGEASRVKSFISTPVDRFRPPYGRVARDFPRQCVFAGTVNPGSIGYLQDETGNRRFWPVACGVDWDVSREADTAGLAAVRDQLWAEAQHRYSQGENHWLEGATLIAEQGRTAAERMAIDVWHDRIAGYVADKSDCSIGEILSLAIAKPAAQQSHADNIRVGRVLRTLGWESRKVRLEKGSLQERRYFSPAFA